MKLLPTDMQHWPVNYNPVQFFWFWISMLLWAVGNILWIAWQQWRACLCPVSWLSSLAGPCTGWCSHPVWGCPWALLPAWSLPRLCSGLGTVPMDEDMVHTRFTSGPGSPFLQEQPLQPDRQEKDKQHHGKFLDPLVWEAYSQPESSALSV